MKEFVRFFCGFVAGCITVPFMVLGFLVSLIVWGVCVGWVIALELIDLILD